MALAKACADLRANAVQELKLFRTNIGDGGALALAEALKENDSLTTLLLQVRLQFRAAAEGGRGTDSAAVQ